MTVSRTMLKSLPSLAALLFLLISPAMRSEHRLPWMISVEAACPEDDGRIAAAAPAGIAAKGWAILDGKTGKPLWGFHDAEARPIASTTKIIWWVVDGGWWVVVGGWWLEGHGLHFLSTIHYPPSTIHRRGNLLLEACRRHAGQLLSSEDRGTPPGPRTAVRFAPAVRQ